MGIFDEKVGLYEVFEAKIKFRGWLMGGQPKSAKALREQHLRRFGEDAETLFRRDLVRLAIEMEIPVTDDMPVSDIEKLMDEMGERTGNGFSRDKERGLWLGGYCLKAAFREVANIAFPYAVAKWGPNKKGAKSYLAERLYIDPDEMLLGRMEPDGVYEKKGNVDGPQGPRAIITRTEYVDQAEITVRVSIARDATDILENIPEIWVRMQDIGLGAMRSSGYGRFDLTSWEQIAEAKKRPKKEPVEVESAKATKRRVAEHSYA